jgi:hypothetical protein
MTRAMAGIQIAESEIKGEVLKGVMGNLGDNAWKCRKCAK